MHFCRLLVWLCQVGFPDGVPLPVTTTDTSRSHTLKVVLNDKPSSVPSAFPRGGPANESSLWTVVDEQDYSNNVYEITVDFCGLQVLGAPSAEHSLAPVCEGLPSALPVYQ